MRDDLTGRCFGKLNVVGYDHTHITPSGQRRAYWECVCECGNTVSVAAQNLHRLKTTSCGCNSSRKYIGDKQRTHGESKTRLYGIWCGMMSRCNNPNRVAYKDYGARGISVCDEWKNYLSFKFWAENNGYSNELTLERRDVNGNYTPSNCEWISKSEQSNNRRSSLFFSYDGVTKNLKQWSEACGVKYSTLRARIFTFGWSFEDAIKTPVKRGERSA